MRPNFATLLMAATLAIGTARADTAAHNVILFVPDGLRAFSVDPIVAPNMHALRTKGVWFRNSHSIFPTFTMPNASAMATGHYLGDTGTFSNTLYTGYPQPFANGTITPFIENDQVLGDIDSHFAGTLSGPDADPIETGYVDEETILAAARAAGYSTAAVGKLGPATMFDHANSALVKDPAHDTRGAPSIIVDDRTGSPAGIPLDPAFAAALAKAGLPVAAPSRGANGASGDNVTPGTKVANTVQQDFFARAVTDVVLPEFKAAGKPFVLVFWSRDPDGTQHNQGDSLNSIQPGINGPTSRAAITNADTDLGRILAAVTALGLDGSTDIIVSADHGFSTISKASGPNFTQSATSFAATQTYQTFRKDVLAQEVPTGFLPPGFVAIDLAHALGMNLFDPDSAPAATPDPAHYPPVDATQPPLKDGTRRQRPAFANGLIGADPANPDVVVAANGGSDLVYLPNRGTAAAMAPRVIAALLGQDYVSGLFVDDSLGSFPGTLPLSAINLKGTALTPIPTIVVNFASYSTLGHGCPQVLPELCTVEIADTGLQHGQGMHGSFSEADVHTFQAAIGPDFRQGFVDTAPSSNADIGKTIAKLLNLQIPAKGTLVGRPLEEALVGGAMPVWTYEHVASEPGPGGPRTYLRMQRVGETRYFDAAGFEGRTVGIP